MSHNVELKNLYLLWNMVTMKVWRTNLYIANWNPALWWAKLSIWNMCFIIPNKHGRSLNLSTPHFDWLERRCLGTNSVLQSIKIHSWHHRGDPALGRLRCFEGHLDIPETGCCICDIVTDATTCFSSRWPWQRPLTPGRSWHSKTLKSLQITVLKAVYGSRLWTIWVWCFQSETWSPITSGVDSASLTLGVEFYTIVIYYDFVQSRVNLPFHTVSLHFPFEFEGQLGYVFCRR